MQVADQSALTDAKKEVSSRPTPLPAAVSNEKTVVTGPPAVSPTPSNPPAAAKPTAAAKPPAPGPTPWNSPMITRLKASYGSGIRPLTYAGQEYMGVDRSLVPEILQVLRNDEQFDYCVDLTAVHYPKRERPFDVIWVLYSFARNQRIRVTTEIMDGESLTSSVPIWPGTNWLEREVYDMFGIEFDGHPDLKRILLPEGWKGHPLRKDYGILQQDQEWVQINLGIESGQ